LALDEKVQPDENKAHDFEKIKGF